MLHFLYTVWVLVALFKAEKEPVQDKYDNWSSFPAVINSIASNSAVLNQCTLKAQYCC